jgi:hypothetical protein
LDRLEAKKLEPEKRRLLAEKRKSPAADATGLNILSRER